MKYIDRSRVEVLANLQGQAAPTSGGAVLAANILPTR